MPPCASTLRAMRSMNSLDHVHQPLRIHLLRLRGVAAQVDEEHGRGQALRTRPAVGQELAAVAPDLVGDRGRDVPREQPHHLLRSRARAARPSSSRRRPTPTQASVGATIGIQQRRRGRRARRRARARRCRAPPQRSARRCRARAGPVTPRPERAARQADAASTQRGLERVGEHAARRAVPAAKRSSWSTVWACSSRPGTLRAARHAEAVGQALGVGAEDHHAPAQRAAARSRRAAASPRPSVSKPRGARA